MPEEVNSHPQLAVAARKIGNDTILIDGFTKFEGKERTWVFTRNNQLVGSVRRPSTFPSTKKAFIAWYKELNFQQRRTLLDLARIPKNEESKIGLNDYLKFQLAYQSWNPSYYSVNYGDGWACNLFLGEALYKAGLGGLKNGKYYPAVDVWHARKPFVQVKDLKNVSEGDIASWNYGGSVYHVEIITQIRTHSIADTGFCSIGAGRGARGGNGTEKCDLTAWFNDQRELHDSRIRFLRVE